MNFKTGLAASSAAFIAFTAAPAFAQEAEPVPAIANEATAAQDGPGDPFADTVYDDNWVSIGVGVGYGASYDGSDDYRVFPLPLIQGQLGPVGLDPRPAGLALDFIKPVKRGEVDFDLGVVFTLNRNRAKLSEIDDPVVELAGELDTAIEVGPTVGVSMPGLLNPFDSLSFTLDTKWDVAGAHDGMTVSPGVTYFTPLSRAAIASLAVSAEYGDDDHNAYYFGVNGAQALASGLPTYAADGGINKVSANLLLGYDLDGDATNGGLALVAIGGYSRLVGDAKNTPYTSIRGDADQWLIGAGIGYTF